MVDYQKYWSCKVSIESESYEDNYPRKPWQGILFVEHRPGGTVYLLKKFNQDTGVVDHDSNSTAIVQLNEIFSTEEEAKIYYRKQCLLTAISLQAEALYYLNLCLEH